MSERSGAHVSVIMAIRSPAPWLEESIRSLALQSHTAWHLIAVLDGEDHQIVDSLRKLGEKVTVICAPTGSGASACRNLALSHVRTDLVAVLDSDDLWQARHLQALITEFESDPSLVLAGTRANTIDAQGQFLGRRGIRSGRLTRVLLLFRNIFIHSGVMYRRRFTEACGAYDERLEVGEDYDLWLRIAQFGSIRNMPVTTVSYRVHDHQTSRRSMDARSQDIVGLSRRSLSKHYGFPILFVNLGERIWRIRQSRRITHTPSNQ